MDNKLRAYVTRPERYANIDGTGEMIFGLMLLGFALAGYLEARLPGNASRWMRAAVIYSSLALVMGLGYWVRRSIKKRITWPRTGYVAYPRGGKSWWVARSKILVTLVVGLGLAFAVGIARWRHLISMGNARVDGLTVFSVAMYGSWVFRMGKEHWWKWLVWLFMILGVLTIALMVPGDFNNWDRPPVLLIGLLWLGSGAATLYSYIHHTKPATPETE
jgi:hypothetical protein